MGLNRHPSGGKEEECFVGIGQIGRSGSSRDKKGNRLQLARLESGRKTDTFIDLKHRSLLVQHTHRHLHSMFNHIYIHIPYDQFVCV